MKTLVLAISGGVDSMVLLDMMVNQNIDDRLIVAHVNHGIRVDSDQDAILLQKVAGSHGLEFFSTNLDLGSAASEDVARQARYRWLNKLATELEAEAIVMAHHQDDVIETMFINLVRGTGWRGLVSLRDHPKLRRPLIDMSKAEIISYALDRDIEWRDDSTNDDPRYLRNYIRQLIVPSLNSKQRQKLVNLYKTQLKTLPLIEDSAVEIISKASCGDGLSRYFLIMSPPEVNAELYRVWLGQSLTSSQIERLNHFVATARNGAVLELVSGLSLGVTTDMLVVYPASIR